MNDNIQGIRPSHERAYLLSRVDKLQTRVERQARKVDKLRDSEKQHGGRRRRGRGRNRNRHNEDRNQNGESRTQRRRKRGSRGSKKFNCATENHHTTVKAPSRNSTWSFIYKALFTISAIGFLVFASQQPLSSWLPKSNDSPKAVKDLDQGAY